MLYYKFIKTIKIQKMNKTKIILANRLKNNLISNKNKIIFIYKYNILYYIIYWIKNKDVGRILCYAQMWYHKSNLWKEEDIYT